MRQSELSSKGHDCQFCSKRLDFRQVERFKGSCVVVDSVRPTDPLRDRCRYNETLVWDPKSWGPSSIAQSAAVVRFPPRESSRAVSPQEYWRCFGRFPRWGHQLAGWVTVYSRGWLSKTTNSSPAESRASSCA